MERGLQEEPVKYGKGLYLFYIIGKKNVPDHLVPYKSYIPRYTKRIVLIESK